MPEHSTVCVFECNLSVGTLKLNYRHIYTVIVYFELKNSHIL
jgi:hypothetical protein